MAYLTIEITPDGYGFIEGKDYAMRCNDNRVVIDHIHPLAFITIESARKLAEMLLVAAKDAEGTQ